MCVGAQESPKTTHRGSNYRHFQPKLIQNIDANKTPPYTLKRIYHILIGLQGLLLAEYSIH